MQYDTVMHRTMALGRAARVADLVRVARHHAGLTQSGLADRINTTQSAVSRWERGGDEPRFATLADIASACGLTVSLVLDDGVDRSQIGEHLAMSPSERLRSVANVSRLRAIAAPMDHT